MVSLDLYRNVCNYNMTDSSNILELLKQHDKLNIHISKTGDTPLPDNIYQLLTQPQRRVHYFFELITKGKSTHSIDLQNITAEKGQLLFILPHQIHVFPKLKADFEYYKLGFDQDCLSLLPRQYLFLINPLNSQLLSFDADAQKRVISVFETLSQLLNNSGDTDLILANLNTLLTEFNLAYFENSRTNPVTDNNLSRYIRFKQIIENELTTQPSINSIAEKLALTTNSLYYLVRFYSGKSPKEYITNRLILEAQRKIFYFKTPVKELAFELGFNDPDYFSKLFKKKSGKSLTQFAEEMQSL